MEIFRNKEAHCIIIKAQILQEDITILNVCVPNNRISNKIDPSCKWKHMLEIVEMKL